MAEDWYCDMLAGERQDVRTVLETERVLAFHHTRPSYEHHIVVIPKEHVPSFVDLGTASEGVIDEVIAAVRQVAADMLARHGACRVITNLGDYQDSKHLHFHVISGDRRTSI